MGKSGRLSLSLCTASLLAATTMASGRAEIHGVELVKTDSGVEVLITGEQLSQPRIARTTGGTVYIASFTGIMKAKSRRATVNAHGVSTIQWTQFTVRPPVSRVVFKLRPSDTPIVSPIEGGFKISLGKSVGSPSADPMASPSFIENPNPLTGLITPLPTPAGQTPKPVVLSGGATRPANPLIAEIIPSMQAKLITLEFDEAEITQILKALAIQAQVNIVTAPEVKGNLTIKLERVTVEHAMNVITAMAGLRYQMVDKTIVVAPPERMVDILRGVNAKDPEIGAATETRIIPIFSKQGRQLKSAAYRMVPQTSRMGRYELVLPSEDVSSPTANPNPTPPVEGTPNPTPAANAAAPATADEYIMIIGQRNRLDEVEKVVRDLDAQLCSALGLEIPSSTAIIQQTYQTKGTSASSLLSALGTKDGKLGNVNIAATPETSNSPQAIVLTGREHEVRRIMNALGELDSEGQASDELEVYEIAHSEPRSLRDELVMQVPGIRVSLAPGSVGNPRLYSGRGTALQVGGNAATPMAQQAQATGQAAPAGGGGGEVGGSGGFQGGLSQPFKSLEAIAQPMRMIMRGSPDQIRKAHDVLKKLDVPPRMVALEVRVMELSKDDTVNLGLDWNIFTGGAVKFIRLRNTVENPNNSFGVGIDDRNFTGDVVGTLDKIANRNNLIARPNMLAPDGRESELFIGDAIRYVETITSSQNGPSVQIGTVRVGINLSVLPRISSDGTMTLDLRPVVSFLTGFKRVSVSGFAAELPQTSERITQQTIPMRSGETFAISGLIQSQDVKQLSGIPILMDLPIIGALFRRTTTQTVRRELVVFVTANAITGPLSTANSELPMKQQPEEKPASKTEKP